jgi:hypothetical protein
LERRGRTTSHYMEGAEGRPPRCRELLAAYGMPQRRHARRQLDGLSHSDRPNLAHTGNDGRTTAYVVPSRRQQYQSPRALHSIGSQATFGPTSVADTSTSAIADPIAFE